MNATQASTAPSPWKEPFAVSFYVALAIAIATLFFATTPWVADWFQPLLIHEVISYIFYSAGATWATWALLDTQNRKIKWVRVASVFVVLCALTCLSPYFFGFYGFNAPILMRIGAGSIAPFTSFWFAGAVHSTNDRLPYRWAFKTCSFFLLGVWAYTPFADALAPYLFPPL